MWEGGEEGGRREGGREGGREEGRLDALFYLKQLRAVERSLPGHVEGHLVCTRLEQQLHTINGVDPCCLVEGRVQGVTTLWGRGRGRG